MADSILGKITNVLIGVDSSDEDDCCCGVEIEEVDTDQ
jgi:hypothetical protein